MILTSMGRVLVLVLPPNAILHTFANRKRTHLFDKRYERVCYALHCDLHSSYHMYMIVTGYSTYNCVSIANLYFSC